MTQENFSNNLIQDNGFTFAIERIPQTTFRIVACDVPSINVPPPQAGYPGATQYFPGSNAEFDTLSIDFLVDENLSNYEEIYRWITQQRFASGFVPKKDSEILLVSDGTLITMTNSSNANRVFYFKDLFPISLGNLHFDSTIDSPSPITCTIEFRYSYFELR